MREPFRTAAQADSFRSSLLTAARNGEAFSIETGRPVSWKRDEPSTSWYALATDYAAAKRRYASPNHRRGIAEALTDATEAMLTSENSPYARDEIRRALRTWAFSGGLRGKGRAVTSYDSRQASLRRDQITIGSGFARGQGPGLAVSVGVVGKDDGLRAPSM